MEGNPFTQFVFQIFIFCAILIIGYTCNFYYLAFLSSHRKDKNSIVEVGEPTITIQLPIYNEKYVATRLVDAVCQQDYPKDKMRIMVLDDSDDDTVCDDNEVSGCTNANSANYNDLATDDDGSCYPYISDPIDNFNISEDDPDITIDLSNHFFDPEGQTLTYQVSAIYNFDNNRSYLGIFL